MTTGAQPVVGWRLWRLHDSGLRSWIVGVDWRPGTNEARCLLGGPAASLFQPRHRCCDRSPGRDCRCGLWALWDFAACLRKARDESSPWDRRDVVIGLMAGWGTVAIHGDEGFRCQYAMVRCLFTDPIAARPPAWTEGGPGAGWWDRMVRRVRAGEPDARRTVWLRRAADLYGVPLLSLADAIRHGVLGELGVPGNQIRDLAAELAAG